MMHISKFSLVSLLALVLAVQACSLTSEPVTPQVITVVVTAAPTMTDLAAPSSTPSLTATSAPTETLAPSPVPSDTPGVTAAPQAAETLVPSPTSQPKVIPTTTPSRTTAPQIPSVSNLPAQGPKGGDIDFEVNMSPYYLMRIKAKKHGTSNDGDGIDHVTFTVNKKNGGKVYSNKETTAKYCIFQGGEPDCNSWPKSNGRYVWGSGGSEITSGDYQVTIQAALKSDPSNESQWTFQITIKLP
jgi:hypothetical protein